MHFSTNIIEAHHACIVVCLLYLRLSLEFVHMCMHQLMQLNQSFLPFKFSVSSVDNMGSTCKNVEPLLPPESLQLSWKFNSANCHAASVLFSLTDMWCYALQTTIANVLHKMWIVMNLLLDDLWQPKVIMYNLMLMLQSQTVGLYYIAPCHVMHAQFPACRSFSMLPNLHVESFYYWRFVRVQTLWCLRWPGWKKLFLVSIFYSLDLF